MMQSIEVGLQGQGDGTERSGEWLRMGNWNQSARHACALRFLQLTIYVGDQSRYQYLEVSPILLKEVIIAWIKCNLFNWSSIAKHLD